MDVDAALSAVTTAELNDSVRADHKCQHIGSKHVLDSPPSSSSLLGSVENNAFGPSLGPITPDPNRESLDYNLESRSPLSFHSPETLCFTSHRKKQHLACSPSTPQKDVFDPFASGPDELLLAPYCRKYAQESRLSVARRLRFDTSSKFATNVDSGTHDKIKVSEEESLLEAMYLTILEVIISTQNKDIAEVSDLLPDSGGFKTPPSAPRLSGVADTCPPAPVKPTNKFRSIDKEICRRLAF